MLKITQEWSPKSHLVMKCQILMFVGLFLKSTLFKDIDVLDVDAKTETAASSENSGRKSTENEQNKRKRRSPPRRHLYWGFPMMQELDDDCKSRIFNKYC